MNRCDEVQFEYFSDNRLLLNHATVVNARRHNRYKLYDLLRFLSVSVSPSTDELYKSVDGLTPTDTTRNCCTTSSVVVLPSANEQQGRWWRDQSPASRKAKICSLMSRPLTGLLCNESVTWCCTISCGPTTCSCGGVEPEIYPDISEGSNILHAK